LDNYPPHIRERTLLKEITAAEIQQTRAKLVADLQRVTRRDDDGNPISTSHTEWLLSRIEMYDKALPAVQAYEAQLAEKEANRIASTQWDGGHSPVVNEVWKP
jgi:hypothetical protein